MYRPIVEIMRKIGMQVNTNHIESKKKPMEYGDVRMPPHALLPEDEPEEVPIHHSQEASVVTYFYYICSNAVIYLYTI